MENDEQISPKYKNELTLQDTNFLKGVAILLMLFHHLFLSVPNGLYDDIKIFNDIYIINGASKSAKMCVTLFVFLSGYGLMMQAKKKRGKFDLKDYYYRRIKKMYLNYWFAWLIFVPISYIVFDYTFHDAYFSSEWLHLVLDLLGVHALAFYDINSYNPTWWFYSCLIICYLIFPLLRNALKEDSLLVLIILYLISFVPISNLYSLRFNLFIFAIGILFATGKLPPPSSKGIRFMMITVLIFCLSYRNFNKYPLFIDCINTVLLVQIYRTLSFNAFLSRIMCFFGKHSMNIFLFHTFIYYMWFRDYIYISRNPLVIFLTLLIICVIVSLFMEKLKAFTINKLM